MRLWGFPPGLGGGGAGRQRREGERERERGGVGEAGRIPNLRIREIRKIPEFGRGGVACVGAI